MLPANRSHGRMTWWGRAAEKRLPTVVAGSLFSQRNKAGWQGRCGTGSGSEVWRGLFRLSGGDRLEGYPPPHPASGDLTTCLCVARPANPNWLAQLISPVASPPVGTTVEPASGACAKRMAGERIPLLAAGKYPRGRTQFHYSAARCSVPQSTQIPQLEIRRSSRRWPTPRCL